jgi:hypothetical protein
MTTPIALATITTHHPLHHPLLFSLCYHHCIVPPSRIYSLYAPFTQLPKLRPLLASPSPTFLPLKLVAAYSPLSRGLHRPPCAPSHQDWTLLNSDMLFPLFLPFSFLSHPFPFFLCPLLTFPSFNPFSFYHILP